MTKMDSDSVRIPFCCHAHGYYGQGSSGYRTTPPDEQAQALRPRLAGVRQHASCANFVVAALDQFHSPSVLFELYKKILRNLRLSGHFQIPTPLTCRAPSFCFCISELFPKQWLQHAHSALAPPQSVWRLLKLLLAHPWRLKFQRLVFVCFVEWRCGDVLLDTPLNLHPPIFRAKAPLSARFPSVSLMIWIFFVYLHVLVFAVAHHLTKTLADQDAVKFLHKLLFGGVVSTATTALSTAKKTKYNVYRVLQHLANPTFVRSVAGMTMSTPRRKLRASSTPKCGPWLP